METEVGVEWNDEGKFEENGVTKSSSAFSSPKQLSDPVVYKLVRLEGNGRLVPATDDEVMEFKGLLGDVETEMHIVADTVQGTGFISNEGTCCGMPQLASEEGILQAKNAETKSDNSNARVEESDSTLAPSSGESLMKQFGGGGECSNASNKPMEVGSSTCQAVIASRPDFSKVMGEICLDNLSIRELHETFKATFGRETTVKDKQWLKRRITMGLTNSCDVSTTSYIIKDNKLVKKDDAESCNTMDGSFDKDPAISAINGSEGVSPPYHYSRFEDHQVISEKRLRNQSTDDSCGIHDHQAEHKGTKRVRKPTRRYIEELSEFECKESGGRSRNLAKPSALVQMYPKSLLRPVRNVSFDGRTIITRLDSIGGSGIQVPCVSRVRRSRPRKNFMALLKFNPNGKTTAPSLVKKAFAEHSFQQDDRSEDSFLKAKSAPEQVYQFVAVHEKDKQLTPGQSMDQRLMSSSRDLNDTIATVPTSKGGIRRKHHRAWTISEVTRLVEGVSRYGAGRWSEIKRLAFASYSYRTSVDLKDKWRNLLKASFAQTPPDGINSRKNTGSMPIPEPILSRVRELAEMQAQVQSNLSSSKVAGIPRIDVNDKQSGYL